MKNIRTTYLAAILLATLAMPLLATNLNMFVDYNRFLDKDKNTVLLVDYQVPYRNLVFLAQNNGYFAELEIQVKLFTPDSLFSEQIVADNIGISNKSDAESKTKTYLNRLSILLPGSNLRMQFMATDLNSQNRFFWEYDLDALSRDAIISDVELNSEVRPDSLQYLAKFHRKNVLYRSEPSILINKNATDFAYLYMECYRSTTNLQASILLNLSLEKDSLIVMDEYMDFVPITASEGISLKIPLEGLKPGRYNGTVLVQREDISEEREFEFVLFEEKEEQFFLFADPDEEYTLMRYFLGGQIPSDWAGLSLDKKRRYGTQFWRNLASNQKKTVPETLALIRERVDYANKYFGHLKPGWTSDMGRIYIRNGAADDIQRDTSSDESRFVRKDYEIWKYSTGEHPVYMFIDIQMNGNFKLIYADDDERETSNPDWLRYVGTDFDTTLLDN